MGAVFHDATEGIGRFEVLDGMADPLATAVKKVIPQGPLKDLLSGTWLGHPLHPLLTDIPIGSFTSATILDFLGGERSAGAAQLLVALGLVSAVPTAAAGAADWSDTTGEERRIGVVHAAANVVGLALYTGSWLARRRGRRGTGALLALAGMGAMTVGGYLGGHLGYTRGVGVNALLGEEQPREWTPVLDGSDLSIGRPVRVEADGAPILLYRSAGRIDAIAARCTHAGGPLEKGEIDGSAGTVECPWHKSVFRLSDGHVVHGPATVPQPSYEVREADDKIEVRRRA